MKKHTLLLIVLAFYLNLKAQIPTINHDHWQTVGTYSVSNTPYQDFNKSVIIEDKLMMIIDTFSGNNPYNHKGIFEYNTITRNTNSLAYPFQDGDRGIQCATVYKTNTPGLTYGIFGCSSGSSVGDNYPVFYTYNSLTSTFTSDSINIGTSSDFEGGISNIAMFSPTTNNDTIRFFAKMNSGTQVYKKHINQTSVIPTSSTIDMEYVNHSFVFNNVLYVAGDSSIANYQLLEKSVDGITFTQPNDIKFFSFPIDSKIALLDTLNGKLLIGVNMVGNSGHQFYSYDGNDLQFLFAGSSGIITSGKHFKNRFWFSTNYFDSGSTANYAFIYYISNGIPFNIITDTSVEAFGGDAIDGNYMNLAATQDSLYFVGNKGTFQPSILLNDNNNAHQRSLILNDRYLQIHKLMPPISSFNYNNNLICLNANETFTSTSQNTDSLHWLYDGVYYTTSPGPSAWMNYNFSTTGNHSVGLVAFGGTLSDTSFLSVNVYSITAAIAGQTLVCLGNSFSLTSTVNGAIGTPTLGWRDNISSPTTDLGTNSSLTYSTTTGGNVYEFYLTVIDAHGCSATSNTINAQCNPLYQIEGQALTGITPTITPVNGAVTLFQYQPFLGKFDSISTSVIDAVGNFNFAAITEGNYILKATPSASTLQITYYGDTALTWKNALPFSHTCLNQSTKNIDVIPLANSGGPGQLSGVITKAQGFQGQQFAHTSNNEFKPLIPGEPIGGIIVKGGRNPGGQMFVQTFTDPAGSYTLQGIPLNTASDSYFIIVDIPGLDTNGTYHPYVTVSTTTITGLDFTVDSIYVNPLQTVTSITANNSVQNNSIVMYPNPAKQTTSINYELTSSALVHIDLYDVVGHKVKSILSNSLQEKNKYTQPVDLRDVNSGIYFVKIKINNSKNIIKLIITN